ncbi:MAG: LPS export ABC transporter periplasmic protein LptC [Proteobacteria bacterium]|nr:LPS export ABC transporter periplasmic protein LptC [Pseudomonadota bacterium]
MLIFIVSSIALLGALAYINYSVKSKLPITVESFERTPEGAVKLEKLHYSGQRDGRVTWELDAESAVYNKEDDLMRLEGVLVKFFSNGTTSHTIKSKSGGYNGESGLIEVSGDVRVETKGGLTLRTRRLIYITSSNEIKTDEDVEIKATGMIVSGTGFEMKIESGSFKMLKDVRTYLTDASL